MRTCPAPAGGRAKPPELARREARPAHEGAHEMGGIGVPEVQRDLDDLAGWIDEHPLRNGEAGPRDDARGRHPLFGYATLERPRSQPQPPRGGKGVRGAIAEQPDDELADDDAK